MNDDKIEQNKRRRVVSTGFELAKLMVSMVQEALCVGFDQPTRFEYGEMLIDPIIIKAR